MADEQPKLNVENEQLKAHIMERLETVIDPELGIDIVNIGLVYSVNLFGYGLCEVQITITTMGCPFGDVIEGNIIAALRVIPEIEETNVKLVWYSAWDP